MRLLEDEQAEIHRILLEMTAPPRRACRRAGRRCRRSGELELQFAKARFAEDYDCVAVTLSGWPARGERARQARRRESLVTHSFCAMPVIRCWSAR